MNILPYRKRREEGANLAPRMDPVNDLIHHLFNWWDTGLAPAYGGWWPALEVIDENENLVVRAEMPGLKSNDIDVSVQGNVLTISGQKKEETEKKERTYYFAERQYGSFQRQVTLPAEVDAEKVEASYKDGVLTLTLPKAETARTRRIAIKT